MPDTVAEALRIIHEADLTPYEHKILAEDFVNTAFEPTLAAAEILRAVNERDHGVSVDEALLAFKHDWHQLLQLVAQPAPITNSLRQILNSRDNGRCCVTPVDCEHIHVEPSHIISPAITTLWEGNGNPRLLAMLEAYLTPAKVQTLKDMLSPASDRAALYNVLLLSPSLGYAIRNGLVLLKPPDIYWTKDDMSTVSSTASSVKYFIIELSRGLYKETLLANGEPLCDEPRVNGLRLKTQSPETMPLPHPELLEMQSNFGQSLRNFFVERLARTNAAVLSEPDSPSFWSKPLQLFFRRIWHFLPLFARSKIYQRLFRLAKRQDISRCVLQLPLGLYAKRCDRSDDNEPAALQMLEKYAPAVPAPLLIDKFQDMDGIKWIIMTKLPGRRALGTVHLMSYAQRRQLADDLSSVLKQIHAIPNKSQYLFSGAGGGRIYDWRCSMGLGCGPFYTQLALNRHLTRRSRGNVPEVISAGLARRHKSVFTHSDLFFCNVLVDNGRLSGIVDWESSGFMPEYWDFTKAMRVVKAPEEIDIYRRIWGSKFDDELKVEQLLWDGAPLGGPEEPEDERVDVATSHWPRVGFRVEG